jgi:hypothetical protein
VSRLFFDHIPRTGGSAFCEAVRATLGPSAVVTGTLSGGLSSILRRHAAVPAICGALDYAPGDELPADRLACTLLREPVERVLSWYTFQRHDVLFAGPRQPLAAACRAMTLLECLQANDPALDVHLRNGQSRHLAALRTPEAATLDDENLLALAIEALECFDVVGTHDALPDFVDVCSARLGWGGIREPQRSRAASHPISREQLDAATLAALAEANIVDAELVRYARERFVRDRSRALRELVAMVEPRAPAVAARRQGAGAAAATLASQALTEYAARVAVVEAPSTLACDDLAGIEVEIHNESAQLWPEGGQWPVRLSYHWLHADGAMAFEDGLRTHLPFDLGPGDGVRLRAEVKAPQRPGRYVLRMGMLQEGVAWFEAHGVAGADVAMEVSERPSAR